MGRIVFTRDELALLRRLAESRGSTPGELLRQLLLQDAVRCSLLEPEPPARPGQTDAVQPQQEAAR